MTQFIMTNPVFREFDDDGLPLAGGSAYFYEAGTETPKDVFTDSAGATAHASPVVLDARGEAVIYGSGAYKVVTKDASGTTIRTVDNYKIFPISAFAETILDDADAAAVRTTLGLGTAALLDAGTNPNNVVQLDAQSRLPAVDGRALDLTNMPDANFPVSVFAFPRSYLAGFTLSNSTSGETPDADHDIDIAAGECRDSTHTANIVLASSMTKQLDASWASGNFAGGLDGGAVQADTWYHVFVIKNPTSAAVDVLFSTSATAPTLPNGYTKFRRLGAVKTDSAANIAGFYQQGDEFIWKYPVVDEIDTSLGTTAETYTLHYVPSGVSVKALLSWSVYNSGAVCHYLIYSALLPDFNANPAVSDNPFTDSGGNNLVTNPADLTSKFILGNAREYDPTQSSFGEGTFHGDIVTNTSAQIKAVSTAAGSLLNIQVNGWIDRRGRDD